MTLVAFRLFWELYTSPEGPCPVHITVTPHVCVCRSSLYGTSCPPVWNKMAAQTLFPLLWPRMHGPWPPTVRTRFSTGWFPSVMLFLEQAELRFSDLIRVARAVKTGVVLRLNPLHMLVTHLGQQVCVSRNCTRTSSGVPDNDITSLNK